MKDEEAKAFIKKLIGKNASRPSAGELLKDPFLNTIRDCDKEFIQVDPVNVRATFPSKLGFFRFFIQICA